MQITLNTNEVSDCVLAYVKEQLNLDDSNTFVVELNEDGITVLVNEDSTDSSASGNTAPTTERPAKKPRRTKAQIEADNKAEAERLAKATEAGAKDTSGNDVQSTQEPVAETQAVVVEAVGETTQEPLAPGDVDPSPQVDSTVVVEEPAEAPLKAEEPEVVTEPVTPKPTTSLFANLRKPNNQ